MSTEAIKPTAMEIAAYNEAINEKIRELEEEKKKYGEAKISANRISKTSSTMSDSSKDAGVLLKQIKINKEPIDKGTFSTQMRKSLSQQGDVFSSIAKECQQRIDEIEDEILKAKTDLW